MAEKKILEEGLEIEYEGLFSIRDLFKEIDQWIRQHGYDRLEKKNHEQVTEKGKQVYIALEPKKTLSDYAEGQIRADITFKDVEDVEIETEEGIEEQLQKGKVEIEFQAMLITDYEEMWDSSAFYMFIRKVVDKFVIKTQISRMESEIKSDCEELMDEIRAFLNLYRYKA